MDLTRYRRRDNIPVPEPNLCTDNFEVLDIADSGAPSWHPSPTHRN